MNFLRCQLDLLNWSQFSLTSTVNVKVVQRYLSLAADLFDGIADKNEPSVVFVLRLSLFLTVPFNLFKSTFLLCL